MNRYDRQMRMQQTVISVLRDDPSLLSDPRLRTRLDTFTGQVGGQLYHRCINRWRDLLDNGDLGTLSRVVLEDSETGGYMRTVSPLGILLNEDQRRDIVRGCSVSST